LYSRCAVVDKFRIKGGDVLMLDVLDFYNIQQKLIPRIEDDNWDSLFYLDKGGINFHKQSSIYSYYAKNSNQTGICAAHTHNFLEMKVYLEAENLIERVNKHEFDIKPGVVLFTNPSDIHSSKITNGSFKRITLGFSPSFIDETILDLGESDYYINFKFLEFFFRRDNFFSGCLHLPEKGFNRVFVQCCQIIHTFNQDCIEKNILIKNHILSMLSSLLLEYRALVPPLEGNDNRISTIIFYVQHNFTKHITISDLAEKFFISKSRLYEIFRKRTGTSLSSYMNTLRLQKAKALLLTTQQNVIQIALDVGFQDISYFNRLFKKKYGASPREIRNNHTPVQ
jgi:AraC-like DNA-binding protein